MKIKLHNISRTLIAFLFIFSGFVKSVDPMGGAIKFEEYFAAFSMDWLSPLSMLLSILLSGFEVLLGLVLLTGIYQKITGYTAQIFMSFFTLLTLYIYIADPVADCGCFGEAVVMSNGVTFAKNIVAMIVLFPFFNHARKLRRFRGRTQDMLTFSTLFVVSFFMPIYAALYLPVVDFLPYKVGVNIFKAMEIPEDAPESIYETTLLYEEIATGKEVEFSVEDTTWYDQSKWKYLDTNTKLIKQGYIPKITSFNIFDTDHNDVTDALLKQDKEVLVVVINDDENLSKYRDKIVTEFIQNDNTNREVIILSRFDISKLSAELGIPQEYIYNGDETMLKSFIRASVGVVRLKNGTIISKENLRFQQ